MSVQEFVSSMVSYFSVASNTLASFLIEAADVIVSYFLALSIISLIWYVIQVVGYWRVFVKAGDRGWKSIIPIYNIYIQYKISWTRSWFWGCVAFAFLGVVFSGYGGAAGIVGIVSAVLSVLISCVSVYRFSQSFGHGLPFAIGLFFFRPIFTMILGFGVSEYVGPQ